jgi:hypothetical protein
MAAWFEEGFFDGTLKVQCDLDVRGQNAPPFYPLDAWYYSLHLLVPMLQILFSALLYSTLIYSRISIGSESTPILSPVLYSLPALPCFVVSRFFSFFFC